MTPLLAGLMECDASRMWTFEQFFAEASNLLLRRRLHVFHVEKCRLLSLYVDPTDCIEEVRCLIFEQTDISPDSQYLLYDSKRLEDVVGPSIPASNYPQTKADNPIILLANINSSISPTEEMPIRESNSKVFFKKNQENII